MSSVRDGLGTIDAMKVEGRSRQRGRDRQRGRNEKR
jgi:hypothetical protein